MNSAKRQPLGRGLAALFGDSAVRPAETGGAVREVAIEAIRPGTFQPRRRFDETELAALAQSVREKGVLQPLLVRPIEGEDAAFELIAGERRWRAAQRGGLHQVPVLVRAMGDVEALEIALIENLQREDLTALEEAEAYRRLIDEFGRTQANVAEAAAAMYQHCDAGITGGCTAAAKRSAERWCASALLAADDPAGRR